MDCLSFLLLTHDRHFALYRLRDRAADGNLERCDVEGRHVVLAAALVIVVDDILADIVIGAGVLYVRLVPAIVDDKDQDQGCTRNAGMDKERELPIRFAILSHILHCLLLTDKRAQRKQLKGRRYIGHYVLNTATADARLYRPETVHRILIRSTALLQQTKVVHREAVPSRAPLEVINIHT